MISQDAKRNGLKVRFSSPLQPLISKLIKRAESFHAVKFFGFPVHGQFDHGQTIGGGSQKLLCASGCKYAGALTASSTSSARTLADNSFGGVAPANVSRLASIARSANSFNRFSCRASASPVATDASCRFPISQCVARISFLCSSQHHY